MGGFNTRVPRWSTCIILVLLLGITSACGVVKIQRPEEPKFVQRSEPFNLGFEEGEPGDRVPGWRFTNRGDYEIAVVEDVKRSGQKSASIRSKVGEAGWGAFNQDFLGSFFAGKVVTVRVWIKTEATEVCDECAKPGRDETSLPEAPRRGAQVRVLAYSPSATAPRFTVVSETLVTPLVMGTSGWTLFEARTVVPTDVDNVIIAPILWGKGTAWFDDLEVVTA